MKRQKLLILSSISSVILIPCFITLLFSNLPHHKFLKINPSPSTDLDSSSNNSAFHQVVCSTNGFLAGLSPGSGKPKIPDQNVSKIKVESEVPWPIFEYPSGYGAERYLLRKATAISNRSCDLYSRVSVSNINVNMIREDVLIDEPSLTYMKGPENPNPVSVPVTFGGNLDVNERKKYFNYSERTELACGFANHGSLGFVVSEEDKKAMEQCTGLVVISAIFGAYDKIKQPMDVRRITAENVCFFMFVDNITLTHLASYQIRPNESHKIGLWRIVLVNELPYNESVMNSLVPKYLPHRLFPNCIYSIWTDAKLQLVVDPLFILESLLVTHKVDIAMSKHPYNTHTMEEAIFTVRWGKWSKEAVRYQMESYCTDGLQPWSSEKLPYISDVPDTALILRKHSLPTNLFSCLVFNEIQVFNPRDQLAFAYVRDMMNPKVKIHMFESAIFNTITNEYRHSKKTSRSVFKEPALYQRSSLGYEIKACKSYFARMWTANSFSL